MEFVLRRRRVCWIVIPVVTVCAVITGGAVYIEHFMDAFDCKTVVRRTILSPDGNNSIVIFGKECGATVGFNTQASIALAGDSFSSEKNPAFFAMHGEHDIMAKWLGLSVVEIAVIPGGDKIFRSEENVGDIRIEYR